MIFLLYPQNFSLNLYYFFNLSLINNKPFNWDLNYFQYRSLNKSRNLNYLDNRDWSIDDPRYYNYFLYNFFNYLNSWNFNYFFHDMINFYLNNFGNYFFNIDWDWLLYFDWHMLYVSYNDRFLYYQLNRSKVLNKKWDVSIDNN